MTKSILGRGRWGSNIWQCKKNLSDNVGNSQSPQIQALGNITFVVWQDNRPGNDEIYLRKSSDGGITFGNATNLSDNVGNSQSPQIQALGNITFVVWQDNRPGNDEIYLRKAAMRAVHLAVRRI